MSAPRAKTDPAPAYDEMWLKSTSVTVTVADGKLHDLRVAAPPEKKRNNNKAGEMPTCAAFRQHREFGNMRH